MQRSLYGIAGVITAIVISSIVSCVTPGSDPNNPDSCDRTDNGYFSVIHPISGDSLKMDSRDSIKWSNKGLTADSTDSTVSLYLYKGQELAKTIQSVASNSGIVFWKVPRVVSGDNYHIKIANAKDTSQFDYSCSFAIYSDSSSAPIDSVDSAMDAYEPDNVQDEASTLDSLGKPYYHTLPVNDTDWVKFLADSGTKYTIQIQGFVNGRFSFDRDSNALFNIGNTAFFWTCQKTGVYYIKFTTISDSLEHYSITVSKTGSLKTVVFIAPTATTVWSVGSSYRIQWFPDSALLGKSVNIYLLKNLQQISSIANGAPNSGNFLFDVDRNLGSGSDYRIKIVNALDTGRNGLSSFFTIQGCETDSFEPDNKRNNASQLIPNGTVQNHTLSMGDTDWITFSIDSGKIYRLLVSGAVATSTRLFYVKDSLLVSDNSWSATGVNDASFKWMCPKSAAWYACVALLPGSTGLGCGAYTFRIAEIKSLSPLTITAPGQGAIWAAGSTQQIQWTQDTMASQYVNIYLFKGQEQFLSIGGSPTIGSFYWSIPSGLATDSTYRVKIVYISNPSEGGFSSPFTITGISSDAYEPDNKRDSASTLSPLGKAQSHTLPMNDTDWVKFSTDSSGNYLVQCSGDLPMAVFLFYGSDASYTTYFKFSPNSSAVTWKSPKAGVWYARIASPLNNEGAHYLFNVAKLDSTSLVTISSPAQGDAWTAGSSYQIKWTPDSAVLGSNINIQLCKGNQITIIAYSSNSGSYSWTVPGGLMTGSDYRVKVSNSSNDAICGYSQVFTINGLTPDSYEPDDTISRASAIATDGIAQSRSLTIEDQDWIRFVAQKDSIYLIAAQSGGNSLPNMTITLIDSTAPRTLTIFEGANPKGVWVCPKTGTYYLLVYTNQDYYGNYSVSIKTYTAGSAASFTNPTALSIWSAGSAYSIEWVPDTTLLGRNVRLQLYNDTTLVRSIVTSTLNDGAYSWTPPSGMITGNKYSIKLSSSNTPQLFGFSLAFTISGVTPDAFEPDDSSAISHTIATTGVSESHTLSSSDKDWFNFSATANYLYVIKTIGAASSMTLYGADGKTSITTARSVATDSSTTISMFCTTPGTYYFRTTSSTTGAYQAMVTAFDSTKYDLTFSSPTAADTLTTGQADTIRWTSLAPSGGNVDIYLNNSSGVVLTIVANTADKGLYAWTIPSTVTPGSDYYIKIISRVNSHIFGSSGVFTIKAN